MLTFLELIDSKGGAGNCNFMQFSHLNLLAWGRAAPRSRCTGTRCWQGLVQDVSEFGKSLDGRYNDDVTKLMMV